MVDYGNTKTPSMHRRLGSATLSQLAFTGDSNPNFLWKKSRWDNTFVKKKIIINLYPSHISNLSAGKSTLSKIPQQTRKVALSNQSSGKPITLAQLLAIVEAWNKAMF